MPTTIHPTIKLHGGPYNRRVIADTGESTFVMSLHDRSGTPGTPLGVAIYKPDATRMRAFWDGNQWLGTLAEIMPA